MRPSAGKPITGKYLAKLWRVNVRHALYHREGRWYNNLEWFPGALFDPDGYITFATESDFRKCRHLRITKETNVPNGIKAIPGYIRMSPRAVMRPEKIG